MKRKSTTGLTGAILLIVGRVVPFFEVPQAGASVQDVGVMQVVKREPLRSGESSFGWIGGIVEMEERCVSVCTQK